MRRGNYPAASASILPFLCHSKIFLKLFDIIYLTFPISNHKCVIKVHLYIYQSHSDALQAVTAIISLTHSQVFYSFAFNGKVFIYSYAALARGGLRK